ncbi:MAG TPA: hypothetical protein VFV30_02485 [Novosphingobium sp.]|nr:hypothetical protein [Novosphingobium sp.]
MLHRVLFAALASLLLAACGRGSTDFDVLVERPPEKVRTALSGIAIDQEIGALIPGLRLVRTEPAANEVLYTVPGDGSFEAAVKLTFEPSTDGKATMISVAVDVPSTKVDFEGKAFVLSESKVETAIELILRTAAEKLKNGESIEAERAQFSQMLTILAVTTDSSKLRLAQDIGKSPDWYMGGMGSMGDFDAGYGSAARGEDPAAGAREEEYKQREAERAEREKAEEASSAMDSARGDSAAGDYAGPEE